MQILVSSSVCMLNILCEFSKFVVFFSQIPSIVWFSFAFHLGLPLLEENILNISFLEVLEPY
jgi:hypothetical protein